MSGTQGPPSRKLSRCSTVPETPLKALIRNRRPGHSLDAPFYVSPEIFAADMELIFGRHWIYVGVEPDVPEPGDAMTVDIGRYSVIVVRDDDMGIQAFHNVCRHRGARILHDEKTTVGNIVCRYHAWTYDLSGALIHAEAYGRRFRPDLPRPESGCMSARCKG